MDIQSSKGVTSSCGDSMPNVKTARKDDEKSEHPALDFKLNVKIDHSKRITPAGREFAERRKAEAEAQAAQQTISAEKLVKQAESLDSSAVIGGFSFSSADDGVRARLKSLAEKSE